MRKICEEAMERKPIARRKLSHEVRDRLLEMIEKGELKSGDQMPSEHEIMDWFQVGRPAVREAMQNLEAMGLITIKHGERATVTQPTAEGVMEQIDSVTRHLLAASKENVANLMEARQVFEASMARLAAERARPQDLKSLEFHVRVMRENLGIRDEFIKADMAFHVAMADISGNPIFPAISRAMLNWLNEYHGELLGVAGLEELTLKEHEAILRHITDRDSDSAARMVSDHILRANELYRKNERKA